MEEVDIYEKNYIPKDLNEHEIDELKKFEEEFGQEDIEDIDDEESNENEIKEIKEKNVIITNMNKKEKNKEEKSIKKKQEKINKKKSNLDMDLDLEDLEDIIKKDYKSNDKNNKKGGNIMELSFNCKYE